MVLYVLFHVTRSRLLEPITAARVREFRSTSMRYAATILIRLRRESEAARSKNVAHEFRDTDLQRVRLHLFAIDTGRPTEKTCSLKIRVSPQ